MQDIFPTCFSWHWLTPSACLLHHRGKGGKVRRDHSCTSERDLVFLHKLLSGIFHQFPDCRVFYLRLLQLGKSRLSSEMKWRAERGQRESLPKVTMRRILKSQKHKRFQGNNPHMLWVYLKALPKIYMFSFIWWPIRDFSLSSSFSPNITFCAFEGKELAADSRHAHTHTRESNTYKLLIRYWTTIICHTEHLLF